MDRPHTVAAARALAVGPLEPRAAYSAARGRVVLFGGIGATADTWEWDGATGRWQVSPAVASSLSAPPVWPAARVNHALTYDPARGTVVMFSGREPPGTGVIYRDVWDWGAP